MKKNLENIENIIFDLGGVILNIDYFKPVEKFKELGVSDFESLYSKANQSDLFCRFEKGLVSAAEFYTEINAITQLNIDDANLERAWNSIILDFPPTRISILRELSTKFNIYLLSNTNIVHFNYYDSLFKRDFPNSNSFSDLFTKAYYSFELGMRKPDSEIYDFALSDSKLEPSKTLFLDDSEQNLIEAEKLGIQTILINETNTLESIFSRM